MKTFTRTALVALLASNVLAACSQKEAPEANRTFDAASVTSNAQLTPEQKGEELALAAEQIAMGHAPMYAYEVAAEALKQDPKNVRARLWAAVLAPAMEFRGILTRVEPLVRTRPDLYPRYRESVNELKRSPEQHLAKFLLNGPKDITTEADLQDVIALFTARLNDLRETIKDIKHEEIAISIVDEARKSQGMSDAGQECTVTRVKNGVYSLQNCDFSKAHQVRLNQADFEALQQGVAGMQVYMTLLNSYDLTGSFALEGRLENLPPEDRIEALLQNPAFGTLRKDNSFGVMPELAKDFVLGVRYAASMQSSLCPSTDYDAAKRPGYLFRDGFCVTVTSAVDAQLRAIDMIVSGTPAIIDAKTEGQSIPVLIDASGFFKAPLKDVRSLLPLKTDSCGNTVAIGDGKFGGLFPNGDLNVMLAASSSSEYCN